MFATGKEAIEYIEALRGRSNFENIKALFARFDNFQDKLKTIHVAGTNGKGSSVDYIASALRKQGYVVGTYTSPYLEVHNDRIRINNVNISDEDFLKIANMIFDEIKSGIYTFFEIDTFIALYYLCTQKVEYAVIEVGLGGRLDATNVIHPVISVITNIGYDHMALLGDTLDKIAFEKAGIIKEKTPVVIGYNMEAIAEEVIANVANTKHAKLIKAIKPSEEHITEKGIVFVHEGETYQLKTNALYQVENATTALTTLNYLKDNNIIKLEDNSIKQGIEDAFWLGRFEKMLDEPKVYIDGAHNIHGIKALARTLKEVKKTYNLKIIFAALGDKETDKMLKELLTLTDQMYVTDFDFYRCKKAEELAKGYNVKVEKDYKNLILGTIKNAKENDFIIITGSLYFISKVRPLFKGCEKNEK